MRPSDLAKATVAALAVLAAAFLAPALAQEPDAAAGAERLERLCGWVDRPEAVVPRLPEGEEPLADGCRAVLRCFSEARETRGGAAVGAEALCNEVLALSPQDLRGWIEVLEAREPAPEACVRFLRCLLPWRDEFARLCARTEDAASLPRPEIEKLLRQSEKLLERIEGLEIPEAKIYLFRLEKCQAFFEYALELEEARRGDGAAGGDG